jgi:dynein heavy chain, axonemal
MLFKHCTVPILQQGIRNTVNEYLQSFSKYDWLWKDDKDLAYNLFMKKDPR